MFWDEDFISKFPTLTDRELTAYTLHKDGKTNVKIGEIIGGVCAERARQIIKKAYRRLERIDDNYAKEHRLPPEI